MAKFITGQDLENVISDIIWGAEGILLIVSPYIKLDDYFKRLFERHTNNPKLHILVVFGKNEGEVGKSFSKANFDFFKQFPNITVIYVPDLHAKYYGNEKKGVITSINLYDYSFKNNVEFGVYTELNLLSTLTTSPDQEAWQTCMKIASENEVIFAKRPVYEKNKLSSIFGKNYVKSEVLHDDTDKHYNSFRKQKQNLNFKKLQDFQEELELGPQQIAMPTRNEVETAITGFCIRTGEKIPFNPKRPFCEKAYKSWAQYQNMDFSEAYCHKTGKPSYGKTSMRKPIL
jgi:hypothetical protein